MALLRGEGDLATDLEGAAWVGISIVTVLEFLSFPGLTAGDKGCFEDFARRVEIVDLTASNTALIEQTLAIRQRSRLKLPDALVAASAQISKATLVSSDRDFSRVEGLDLVSSW